MVPVQRTCDVENLYDFTRYYQGSWVGWHPTDAAHIQPTYVNGVGDRDVVVFRFLSKNPEGNFLVNPGFPVNWKEIQEHIDFGVPDIGMFQDGPSILYYSYNTPRAAKKGFRPRDTQMADFNSWAIRKKYALRGDRDKYDWVWHAFNPEYSTLEKAENILAKGEVVGVPISRTLGVYTLPKFRYSLLAYKRWTVGHVINPYLISIKPQFGDYEEEIARQTGAKVSVG